MTDFGDSMNGVYAEGVAELPTGLAILENVPSITATTLWNVGRVQNTMLGGSRQFRVGQRGAFRRNTIGLAERVGSSAGRGIFNAGRAMNNVNKILPRAALNAVTPSKRLGDRFLSNKDFLRKNTLDPGTGGFIRQGFNETFRPSRFRRFSRAAAIDPSNYAASDKMYSPFQLARIGNALVSGDFSKMPLAGKFLPASTRVSGLQKRAATKLGVDLADDMPAFSSGLIGRIGVNAQLASMSGEKFLERQGALLSSLNDIRNVQGGAAAALTTADIADQRAARMAVTAGVRSQVGGKIMGYLDVAKEFQMASKAGSYMDAVVKASDYAEDLASMGNKAATAGARKAVAQAASREGGTMLLRYAPKLAAGARFLPGLGNALLIKDLFSVVGKGIGAVARTGMEAGQSIVGSIDKPLMGMGYKDNSVAATSRQRGVMAIQNSQLNARSILGSEAAGLHAHFG